MSVTVGTAKQMVAQVDAALADSEGLQAKVKSCMVSLDADKSGQLDSSEAVGLVHELCSIMNLPLPDDATIKQHFKIIDQSGDDLISEQECGSAVVGALLHKRQNLAHFLSFAERDKLGDDATLPHE